MAGPSVMVRILGDVTGLGKSFADSGSKAKSAAQSAQSAFGSLLGTLNKTGVLGPFGEALDTANEAFGNMLEHGKKVSDVMLGAGGALVGVGTAFSVLGSKEKAAHQQLAAAIAATGQSYDTYGKQIDEAIKHEEKFGNSSEQTQGALQALTEATHSPAEALKLLSVATDLAAAKHESLTQASTDLGKVYNGNTKLLKQYGIVVDAHTHKTKDGQTATQALADVLKGQASASADTFNGKVKALTTSIEDQAAKFGAKYGPALQTAGGALAGLGAIMKTGKAIMDTFTAGQETATAATDAMSASEDAAAVSEGLALWPILLIIAAIGLLVLAAYEIAKHWKEIWAGIKAIIVDVWDWIKKNWPLLLGIITGPIGLAVVEIIKHWKDIKQAAVDVWNWLKNTWNDVYGFIKKPISDAIDVVKGTWHWITDKANDVLNFFKTTWSALKDHIMSPFKSAFNAIADIWNDTVGSISFHIPSWVPGLGGKGFDMPKIPHMAQGGLITADGLIFAHAGEAIIPAPKSARQGPAVIVQNAQFSSDVDVDAFMRRVAWVVRTQKV